jgi:hypothetical protein
MLITDVRNGISSVSLVWPLAWCIDLCLFSAGSPSRIDAAEATLVGVRCAELRVEGSPFADISCAAGADK